VNNESVNQLNENENKGIAYLTVRVSTGDNAIPLPGVKVIIRDGDGDKGILYNLITDRSGETETVSVSVPPKESSLSPSEEKQYGTVNIDASLKGYHTMTYSYVPLFDSIYATQLVKMIPLSDNGQDYIFDYRENMQLDTEENSL